VSDQELKQEKKRVVVFSGSACSDGQIQALGRELGSELARKGYVVVNGGGPGLMNEVLKGAKSSGGRTFSVQLNKHEREQSPFSDDSVSFTRLRPRQDEMLTHGDAFIALPGGIGTLYEVLEIMALKNTGELEKTPLILLSDHYLPFLEWMNDHKKKGMVPSMWERYYRYAPDIASCIRYLEENL